MPRSHSFLTHRVFFCFIFGISSGLPLAAAGGTLQAWMKNSDIQIQTIGLFALTGIPYAYKFIWSPLMDRYSLGDAGRRRGWMLLTQFLLALGFLAIAALDPAKDFKILAALALGITFVSASQDIVLDAYRRDILDESELGLGSSLFVAGYRIGLLLAGALALWLSSVVSWPVVYVFLAAWMAVSFYASVISPEPEMHGEAPSSLIASIREPFIQFISRKGAWMVLLFALLYKLGDTMAASLSGVFILDIGFSNAQLGFVGKTFGLTAAIIGGLIGGSLIPRLGLIRSLLLFGIIQGLGILPFAMLSKHGGDTTALAFTISIENLTSGMGTAAFLAFLAGLCDRRYSATQYALLTSIVAMPRTLLASSAGYLAAYLGWYGYFVFCTVLALPGIVMLLGRQITPPASEN